MFSCRGWRFVVTLWLLRAALPDAHETLSAGGLLMPYFIFMVIGAPLCPLLCIALLSLAWMEDTAIQSPQKPQIHIGQASSAPYRIPHSVATDNEENTGLQKKTSFLLVKPDFLIIFAWLFPLPSAAPHASRRPLSPSPTLGALSREQQWQASEQWL